MREKTTKDSLFVQWLIRMSTRWLKQLFLTHALKSAYLQSCLSCARWSRWWFGDLDRRRHPSVPRQCTLRPRVWYRLVKYMRISAAKWAKKLLITTSTRTIKLAIHRVLSWAAASASRTSPNLPMLDPRRRRPLYRMTTESVRRHKMRTWCSKILSTLTNAWCCPRRWAWRRRPRGASHSPHQLTRSRSISNQNRSQLIGLDQSCWTTCIYHEKDIKKACGNLTSWQIKLKPWMNSTGMIGSSQWLPGARDRRRRCKIIQAAPNLFALRLACLSRCRTNFHILVKDRLRRIFWKSCTKINLIHFSVENFILN